MNRLLLIRIDELRPHEEVDEDRVRRVVRGLQQAREFHPPLLVDEHTRVILDGHHRYWAGRHMGCLRLPCYCVDYLNDDAIVVMSWRPDITVTKQQVIDSGLGGRLFPEKTTRHIYRMPDVAAPLISELKKPATD